MRPDEHRPVTSRSRLPAVCVGIGFASLGCRGLAREAAIAGSPRGVTRLLCLPGAPQMTTDHLTTQEGPRPLPLACVMGDTLCHVYVLSDDQWAAIPERRRRNMTAVHIPGLGWAVASPGRLS